MFGNDILISAQRPTVLLVSGSDDQTLCTATPPDPSGQEKNTVKCSLTYTEPENYGKDRGLWKLYTNIWQGAFWKSWYRKWLSWYIFPDLCIFVCDVSISI